MSIHRIYCEHLIEDDEEKNMTKRQTDRQTDMTKRQEVIGVLCLLLICVSRVCVGLGTRGRGRGMSGGGTCIT